MRVNEFLDKILDRILEGVSENYMRYFNIQIVNDRLPEWADINCLTGIIRIKERLILIAENEAELAFVLGHEVGHVLSSFFHSQKLADRKGIELITKAGYNPFCAVDILKRIKRRKRRRHRIYRDAKKYFKDDQKKWILFTPEDLEKVKNFIRNN